MSRYRLVDRMPGVTLSEQRQLFAVATGETRPPLAGEWYLSGAIVEAYRAPNDLTAPHRIARIIGPDPWTVDGGRTLAFDGVPVLYIEGLTDDRRGLLYHPAELDTLTREIAAALNAARVDGSKVAR